jgi:hypothetical protein
MLDAIRSAIMPSQSKWHWKNMEKCPDGPDGMSFNVC